MIIIFFNNCCVLLKSCHGRSISPMVAIENWQSFSSMIVVAFLAAIIWWLVAYPLRSLVISRPMSLVRTQQAAICLSKTTSSRLHVRQKVPIPPRKCLETTIPTINLHVRACRQCLINSCIHEGSHLWKAATIIQSWFYVLHLQTGICMVLRCTMMTKKICTSATL